MPFFPNGCRALLVQRAERARQGRIRRSQTVGQDIACPRNTL